MRTVAVLVNPAAGRGRAAKAAPEVLDRLRAGGVNPVRVEGADADDGLARARAVVATGVDALVACGGDGTVHQALQAVQGTGCALGIIPVGSGDDNARSLGIPRKDIGAAVDVVLRGATRMVDVAEAALDDGTRRWFLGVLSAGFDSMVNERANAMSFPPGQAKYVVGIVAELGVFQPVPYTLVLDGAEERADGMLVAVGNGASYGGGMMVCPGALVDDGLLSVVLLGKVSKPTFLRVFPRVFTGTHIEHPAVSERTAREVRIEGPGQIAYADGERVGELPVTIRIHPASLPALTP